MADEPINTRLTPSNILGIIQRSLSELNSYCNQQPQDVDPHLCMRYLEETAKWVGALPLPQQYRDAQAPEQGDAPRGRAN